MYRYTRVLIDSTVSTNSTDSAASAVSAAARLVLQRLNRLFWKHTLYIYYMYYIYCAVAFNSSEDRKPYIPRVTYSCIGRETCPKPKPRFKPKNKHKSFKRSHCVQYQVALI